MNESGGVMFSAAAADRIAAAVRRVESQDGPGPAAPRSQPRAAELQEVRTTSGTPDGNGHYDAVVTVLTPPSTYTDYAAVKLKVPNAEALANATRYSAQSAGTAPGGLPLYLLVGTAAAGGTISAPFALITSTLYDTLNSANHGMYVGKLVTLDPSTGLFDDLTPGTTVILRAAEFTHVAVPRSGQYAYYRVEATGQTVTYSGSPTPLYTILSAHHAASYDGAGLVGSGPQYMGRGMKAFDAVALASTEGELVPPGTAGGSDFGMAGLRVSGTGSSWGLSGTPATKPAIVAGVVSSKQPEDASANVTGVAPGVLVCSHLVISGGTVSGYSIGVSDGDKGDVVVSSSGAVWSLDTTGVSAATYTNATITVDAKGRITAASSGGGLSDGDKGDVVVSSSGAVWTIDSGAVTSAKMSATGVTAGLYTDITSLTIDDAGRVTAISGTLVP